MIRTRAAIYGLLTFALAAAAQTAASPRSIPYDVARQHEIKPHRRTIPLQGMDQGFNQLNLTLTISPTGDVTHAKAEGESKNLKFWPQLQGEVEQWRFVPFAEGGHPVTAEIEEYVDLVPPERLPKVHVAPPAVKPDSKVAITLDRSGCMGTCPSYSVSVRTDGIVFDGSGYVVASGKHTDRADSDAVRKLAKKFVAADFYSMDESYVAGVTDNPTYVLTISIDGESKKVSDYVGQWVGMPAIISDLEEEVDTFARTDRWIEGSDGLVAALHFERFNFHTFDAQVMLKEVASRGNANTLRELLESGIPLAPLPTPKLNEPFAAARFDHVGWLNAASRHSEALQFLIGAGASSKDQSDKDLALAGAAAIGDVKSVNALIAYGANPNADLRKLLVTEGD